MRSHHWACATIKTLLMQHFQFQGRMIDGTKVEFGLVLLMTLPVSQSWIESEFTQIGIWISPDSSVGLGLTTRPRPCFRSTALGAGAVFVHSYRSVQVQWKKEEREGRRSSSSRVVPFWSCTTAGPPGISPFSAYSPCFILSCDGPDQSP